MRLSQLRVANAVMVGNTTQMFFTDEKYELVLDAPLVWITCRKTKHTVFTSLYNAPFGEVLVDCRSNEDAGPSKRGPKKKFSEA